MSALWLTVISASLGCYLLKLIGVVIPKSFLERPLVNEITHLLPIALLSAIVAIQTLGQGQGLLVDARLPALGASLVALRFKAPFIVVILVAAATAASLRYFGFAA
jgi:branched-subunit amino acid transport protein